MNDRHNTVFQISRLLHHMQGQHWIGGASILGGEDEWIETINPSNGLPIAQLANGKAAEIDLAVQAAHVAKSVWAVMAPSERGRVLHRFHQLILENTERLAQIECADVGKPFAQARADMVLTARYFEFYAGACDKFAGHLIPLASNQLAMAERVPLGVTGHIIPWNYPAQIFGRSVGASLAAGNTCVVKPAEDASLTILELAHLAHEAGLPAGALNIVTGYGHDAGAALSAHHGIHHISFTGSTTAGALVAQACGERHCPVTLELGGKSAQLIFADADLNKAIPAVVNGIIQNAGQTCSAGSRVLIEKTIYTKVLALLADEFSALVAGPSGEHFSHRVGPVINARQRHRIVNYLGLAIVDQVKLVARGRVAPDAPAGGFFVEPHLFADVAFDHALAQEEIFGPILVAMPFDHEEHAVELANSTQYGLVAGVWTQDGARALRVARQMRAGQVFVNNYGAGGGVELPFGGFKHSGHGREKGLAGLESFTTLRTIVINHS